MAVLHRALAATLILASCGGDEAPSSSDGTPSGAAYAGEGAPIVGLVGEAVTLLSAGSTGTHTWTLPDGSEREGPSVEHTFDTPGHFSVFLQTTSGTTSDVVDIPVTVHWPVSDEPRAGAGPLAELDGVLYVAMPDHDRIARVDVSSRALLDDWATCDEPRSVATADGLVAVACAGDDTVEVFDASTGTATPYMAPWGSRPVSVVRYTGGWLVALQGSGELWDLTTTSPALPDVRGLAVLGDRILASQHRSPSWGGEVLDDGTSTTTLAFDPGPDSDTNTRGLPTYLRTIAIRPDGRVAVVGGLKANIERGLYVEGRELTPDTTLRSDLRQLPLVADETLAQALFDDRDQVSAMTYTRRGDWLFVAHLGMETVDVLDSYTLTRSGAVQGIGHGPDGLWVSPDDAELWVVASLSRQLVVYDLTDGLATPDELARIDLQPPSGEPLDPQVLQGKVIFHRSADIRMSEQGYLACSSCHLDGDADGRTWDFTQRGEGLRNTIALTGRAGVAPIHWTANFDEVQDFENDIRTGQGGHGFLSEDDWLATMDTLGTSKAGLSPELDALAAYVQSLDAFPRSPYRQPDGSLTADAVAGQAIFEDPVVGCATCHPAPAYTDSAWTAPGVPLLHDVGTLGPGSGQRLGGPLPGLDTPTLRGVWETPPYLHDGTADTLREVLVQRNAGDLHGVTSGLTATELDQLEAFLLQLQ